MSHERLPGPALRQLKALSHSLKPVVSVGKAGLTSGWIDTVKAALAEHELIKVRFEALKEQKKALAPEIAERTESHVVRRVGNVLVLFRQNPNPERRKIRLAAGIQRDADPAPETVEDAEET